MVILKIAHSQQVAIERSSFSVTYVCRGGRPSRGWQASYVGKNGTAPLRRMHPQPLSVRVCVRQESKLIAVRVSCASEVSAHTQLTLSRLPLNGWVYLCVA